MLHFWLWCLNYSSFITLHILGELGLQRKPLIAHSIAIVLLISRCTFEAIVRGDALVARLLEALVPFGRDGQLVVGHLGVALPLLVPSEEGFSAFK